MSDETNLHGTTDATVWAAEFCKRWPSALCQIEGREGVEDGDEWEATIIGWFANAIMAGVDSVPVKALVAEALEAEREAIAEEIEDWQLFTKYSRENVTMELATTIRNRGNDDG